MKANLMNFKWVLPVIAGLFVAWSAVQAVPGLKQKIDDHEHRVTVLESKFEEIKDDLKDIKRMLRPR